MHNTLITFSNINQLIQELNSVPVDDTNKDRINYLLSVMVTADSVNEIKKFLESYYRNR